MYSVQSNWFSSTRTRMRVIGRCSTLEDIRTVCLTRFSCMVSMSEEKSLPFSSEKSWFERSLRHSDIALKRIFEIFSKALEHSDFNTILVARWYHLPFCKFDLLLQTQFISLCKMQQARCWSECVWGKGKSGLRDCNLRYYWSFRKLLLQSSLWFV